jgi:hypothetical protein
VGRWVSCAAVVRVQNVDSAAVGGTLSTKCTPEEHNCTRVARRRALSTKCTRIEGA